MQVITTFFNNEKFYRDNFIFWYRNIWKADKFIFFIGRNEILNFNYTTKGINFLITENNDIITYEYMSRVNTTDQWNFLKHSVFHDIIKEYHNSFPSLWIDCDEFIYSKNINKLLKDNFFQTHFYEYIPRDIFKLNDDSLWSKCGWYYRSQAVSNNRLIHDCKSFCFEPTKSGLHMNTPNDYCVDKYNYDDYENICFHIGICSKDHYLTSKHWLQTHPNGIEISELDRQSGILSGIFDKYYAICNYETFRLNLYERYLKKNINIPLRLISQKNKCIV